MKKFYLLVCSPHSYRPLMVCVLLVALLFGSASVTLASHATQPKKDKVSVSFNNVTLEDVLQYLKKETGYYVLYNSNAVKSVTGIRLQKNNISVDEVLKECLRGTNLDYAINDDTIVIKTRQEKSQTPPQATENQESTKYVVTGKVTNQATKAPLAGVTVYIKGTNIGAVSDAKGEYALILDRKLNQTITYSLIGMETREVVFTGQSNIDVALAEKVESIGDVVVTGYTTIKKESFTGNTTRITQDELIKVSPKNIIGAIQVFDPSFRLVENINMGSDPNSLPEFYIRGQNSINMELSTTNSADISRQNLTNNSNLPIFILDGFEVDVEKIYDMDPSRIHSLTLLKDAAATAMYGSRAANGVVVIESRAPEAGKLRITYNFTGSVEMPDLTGYNLMNAREKLAAEVAAGYYSDRPVDANQNSYYWVKLNEINRGVNTDWLSFGIRTPFNHKHNLYIDGGENDVRWGVELKYDANNGVMKGSSRNIAGAGLFLDYRIGKFQIINRTSFDSKVSKEDPSNVFSNYTHLQPYYIIRDEQTGRYLESLGSGLGSTVLNPLYETHYLRSYNRDTYDDVANKLAVNYYINSHLTAKAWLTLEKKYIDIDNFIDPGSHEFNSTSEPDRKGSLNTTNGTYFSYEANAMLSYNQSIKKHFLNFSAVGNLREENTRYEYARYTGFASGGGSRPNDAQRIDAKPTSSSNKTRLAGFLLLGNYNYDDIYLFDLSCRLDASSEFGDKNRVAPFWATGVGINIHNYGFLKNNPVISRLKVRGSYGQTGKVNFPVYAAKSSYTSTSIDGWYATGIGQAITYMGNPNLGWEKTNTTDIGIEFGMFDDRFMLRASYYNKRTVDQITSVTLPTSSGFKSYMDNLGEIQNRGYELDLRYTVYRDRDLEFTVYGNLTHNRNKILKVNDALRAYNELVMKQYDDYDKNGDKIGYQNQYTTAHTMYVEGGSLTAKFGMKSLGINPANGREVFVRPDGSVTYEWNAADQQIIYDTEPDAQGSFGLNARWKNFSLFASFLYEFGGQAYNSTLLNYVEDVNLMQTNADRRVITQRWQHPGDLSPLKSIADKSMISYTRPTSRFVQDNNILRFNSLSISYDFNSDLIKKWGMGMLRLTATMNDLGYYSSILRERGLDYPFSRTVNFTMNVTF